MAVYCSKHWLYYAGMHLFAVNMQLLSINKLIHVQKKPSELEKINNAALSL